MLLMQRASNTCSRPASRPSLRRREMYRRRTGTTVDGVIAADPVALSYLLRATGPITLSSGASMTAENG